MREKFTTVIHKYIPTPALSYCVDLWDKFKFSFKVTKERSSKLGDYRYHKIKRQHIITVNGSLNQYAFLVTYLHEVAHLIHFESNGNNNPPHGIAWKRIFRELLLPVLTEEVFPYELIKPLKRYINNPKASSQSDPQLLKALKIYDSDQNNGSIYLEDIPEGISFELNGRYFSKIEKRRTRSLCRELKSGRKFLISEMAQVKVI